MAALAAGSAFAQGMNPPDEGPIDGKIGPQTKTAIATFQKRNGLRQTAQLDGCTMNALLSSRASSRWGGQPPPRTMQEDACQGRDGPSPSRCSFPG